MSANRIAYVLLVLDVGAIFGCLVVMLAAWLPLRAARSTPPPDAASADTSVWEPGWNAPTAPISTLPATDPWGGVPEAAQPPAPLDLPAAAALPWWDGPTRPLARMERRRHIERPRNDPPLAAEPRYLELTQVRPRLPESIPPCVDYFPASG